VFRAVGGFDERFFMFYEDVDLGWRLNLLSHRVRYVPAVMALSVRRSVARSVLDARLLDRRDLQARRRRSASAWKGG
jgi:GT2 family glycosyltransferase